MFNLILNIVHTFGTVALMTTNEAFAPPAPSADRHRADAEAAGRLATAAGAILLDLRDALSDPTSSPDAVRKAGDRLSHEFLMHELGRSFPADAVLSEEGADDAARLGAARVWIVDPLDGTREFGQADRCDWAVHVALVEHGELVAGAVALPALGTTLTSAQEFAVIEPRPVPRVLVSRTRRPAPVLALADALGAELVEMGSAGAKAMAVVRGEAEIYAHAGGQYEWDSAAPVAVARAAGLHVSRLDGSDPVYNQENPWLPDLLICRPEWAAQALEVLTR